MLASKSLHFGTHIESENAHKFSDWAVTIVFTSQFNIYRLIGCDVLSYLALSYDDCILI